VEYNLTSKQKEIVTWLVERNRAGELDEEFSVMWVMGPNGAMLMGRDGNSPSGDGPEITPGVLSGLADTELIQQDIRYQTKTTQGGTAKRPTFTEKQSETSRLCTLTRKAYEAVDSGFVMPDPLPSSSNFHFYGDVNQSIIGTQTRAELTNNFDFGNVRERIDREGGEDREELHKALDHVERLLERGEYLDRGALAKFSDVMEQHSWFTASVMSALLGFATQIVT
jgi:hypothetical protein